MKPGVFDKISAVAPILDKIVLQNDQILLWQQRRDYILKDGGDKTDDAGIGNVIRRCESIQQRYADTVFEIDNRGTARVKMMCDYIRTLGMPHVTEDIKRLLKNRMIIMGLLPVYRLRSPKQTKVITEMLGQLPTTGRDYSRYEWRD
ncbi:MAG: hypothetical protein IKS41_06340 [Alphaproteobacteria bacterium]|nr:hypothetical protein [Alphaproteobacteria bacterium]